MKVLSPTFDRVDRRTWVVKPITWRKLFIGEAPAVLIHLHGRANTAYVAIQVFCSALPFDAKGNPTSPHLVEVEELHGDYPLPQRVVELRRGGEERFTIRRVESSVPGAGPKFVAEVSGGVKPDVAPVRKAKRVPKKKGRKVRRS